MNRREILAVGGALAAWPALAQSPGADVTVDIQTGAGLIIVELYGSKAPITAANFLRYVDAHRFDGASFYRAARTPGDPTDGLIEGGLQNHPAKLFPPIRHESTLQTGLKHKDGTISMARAALGTAAGDFFICAGDASYLDANPAATGDNAGYAAFGQVTEGMDVVRAILVGPTTDKAPIPEMKGQMLDPPVPILKVRRAA
jgi:peptidyl-prolyl cis-trans isomerase A (cyclophilin A)